MKFTDVFIGMLGRMRNTRVFRNSPIFHQLLNVQDYHIIGDSLSSFNKCNDIL